MYMYSECLQRHATISSCTVLACLEMHFFSKISFAGVLSALEMCSDKRQTLANAEDVTLLEEYDDDKRALGTIV